MDRGRRGPRPPLAYGRLVSLLADPPLLFANGEVYGRLGGRRAPERRAKAIGAAGLTAVWGVGIPLYPHAPRTRPPWRGLPRPDRRAITGDLPRLPGGNR